MSHNYIGTEHILLGLAREPDSTAMQILRDFDLDFDAIQSEVVRALSTRSAPDDPPRHRGDRLRDELDRIRREKQEALEKGSSERAARLRDLERRLRFGWGESNIEGDADVAFGEATIPRASSRVMLVAGLVVAALGFPLGLLVGWLIWG